MVKVTVTMPVIISLRFSRWVGIITRLLAIMALTRLLIIRFRQRQRLSRRRRSSRTSARIRRWSATRISRDSSRTGSTIIRNSAISFPQISRTGPQEWSEELILVLLAARVRLLGVLCHCRSRHSNNTSYLHRWYSRGTRSSIRTDSMCRSIRFQASMKVLVVLRVILISKDREKEGRFKLQRKNTCIGRAFRIIWSISSGRSAR